MTGTELDRLAPGALLPMSVSDAAMTMRVYQDICAAVLTADDWQEAGEGGKRFVTRSGFQKLSTAYGLSTAIVSLDVDRDDEGRAVRAHAIVRATHHSGRAAEGDGACERSERGRRRSDKPEHDLRATATTRATNRAISNLIAFGQMSAEEVELDGAPAPASGEPPAWAQHVEGDELADAAQVMVAVVGQLGVPDGERAAAVKALGAVIRGECGGGVPRCVVRTIEHLRDLTTPTDAELADADVVQDPPESAPAGQDGSDAAPSTPDAENGVSGPENDDTTSED